MRKPNRAAELRREVIPLEMYSQLDLYLGKFAEGERGLLLLLGGHGTGKSEKVKRALRISPSGALTPTAAAPIKLRLAVPKAFHGRGDVHRAASTRWG